jgi:(E)-4-hydroxy-3-methyl-but-2-enyl pyrophosphate reductase
VSNAERRRLRGSGKRLIDTTCPLVRRVHEAAFELQAEGRHVLLIGKHGHVEVQGIVEDLDSYEVIEDASEVRCYESRNLGIVCQTTMPPDLVTDICTQIQLYNPLAYLRLVDTVCEPTKRRQRAMLDLLDRVDAVVVVGGRHSNNSVRLVQICRRHQGRVLHVEGADDLEPAWFDGVNTVGLSAGTSTLDETIDAVHQALEQIALRQQRRGSSRWMPRAMRLAPQLDPDVKRVPTQRRYALLINPFYPKDPHASFGKHVLTPSLALTSIAASTPSDWEVRYWDENLLQGAPPQDPLPEVVGISVHLTFADRAYALARWYRERGSIVVLGGLHVMSCPEEAASHADALAIGDGVAVWGQILQHVDAGELREVYRADFHSPYRASPPPRRDLLDRAGFLTTTSLIATRGCHNRCGFCYLSTKGVQMPFQTRDAEQIADEFRQDGQPYGVFTDNNLGSRPEYLRELCRALRPLEKIWSAAVSIDVTDDPALVREMALAGCTGVFIGFESLQNENITDSGKRSPRTEDYARRVDLLHRNGIQVNGSFVLGFDHDREDVFERTVEWVESNRLECATFHILTPYPGTPLFSKLEAEGRLLHREWDKYDTAHVVFRPKHLSVRQLAEGYAWCYRRLFSHASIWRRRPLDWRAVPPYLAMSYLYKRSNWLWHLLIRHRLTSRVWRPLVELTRRRHVRFRRRLERDGADGQERGDSALSAVAGDVADLPCIGDAGLDTGRPHPGVPPSSRAIGRPATAGTKSNEVAFR